ncbi:hypothetical protein GC174_11740 [bacterium]|nr:hypothetical protein [bacterium]
MCWSPDGERGALDIPGQGIRLIGPEGEKSLTDVLLPDAISFAWENDKNHLLAVTEKNEKDWGRLKELIDEEEQTKIIETTQEILRLQKKYGSLKSEDGLPKEDSEKIETMMKEIRLGDVLTYMFSIDPTALATFMKENDKKADEWSCPVYSLKRYSVKKNSIEPESTICTTRRSIQEYATSPNGKAIAVACTQYWGKESADCLKLYPTDGGEPISIKNPESKRGSLAWLESKNWLIHLSQTGGNDIRSISADVVMDDDGNLLKEPKIMQAFTMVKNAGRIVCAGGDRIFFASSKVTLPCAPGQYEGKQSVYMISPLEAAVPTEIVPVTIGGDCKHFDVSPDGKHIAVMDMEGRVSLYILPQVDDKQIQELPFTEKQAELSLILPRFRNNDELSFCAPIETEKSDKAKADKPAPKGAELVIYSIKSGKSKTISKSWTTEVAPFLMKYVEEKDESSDEKQEK